MNPEKPHPGVRTSHGSSKRRISRGAVGALVGAAVGGVLGNVIARKVRAAHLKKLVPTHMPAIGKRAMTVVKSVADDAMFMAKTTAAKAAGQAISEAKAAAQHFVVDVALGQPSAPVGTSTAARHPKRSHPQSTPRHRTRAAPKSGAARRTKAGRKN